MPSGVRDYPELKKPGPGGRKLPLAGKKFGRLTVQRDSGERDTAGHVIWLCLCSCGNKELVRSASSDLKRGHSTSCKCSNREHSGRWNTKAGRPPA